MSPIAFGFSPFAPGAVGSNAATGCWAGTAELSKVVANGMPADGRLQAVGASLAGHVLYEMSNYPPDTVHQRMAPELFVAVLGAGGTIAPAIVHDLAESDEVGQMLLLDLDLAKADAVAKAHGGGKASPRPVRAAGGAHVGAGRDGV